MAKLARCPRCQGHTLVDERAGIRIAVDVAPADAAGFGLAVASGRHLYWVENTAGRGSSVRSRYSGAPGPSWGGFGSQAGTQGFGRLHAEHSCGAPARDQVILNVQSPKDSAPATPGAAGAGNRPRAVLVAEARGLDIRSPATTATPRPSEVLGRCGVCNQRVQPGQPYWAITWGSEWIDGQHEECP